MFRKIVSNLPFSPALVGQLGFYARRLRKEELTRRIGLIFTVLALAVQSLAVFSPPEAANASGYRDYSSNSIVNGGALTISELRQKYNRSSELQAIYSHYGLTSSIINSGSVQTGLTWRNGNVTVDGKVVAKNAKSLGRHNSSASTPIKIGKTTYYSRASQTVFLSDSITSFVFLDKNGKFIAAILLACGNPVAATSTYVPPKKCKYNPSLVATSADCKPCQYNAALWYKDSKCKPPVGKCKYNTALPENSPECKPCQYNSNLWHKDAKCQPPCKYNGSLLTNSSDCKPCTYNSKIWYKDSKCKAPAAACATLTRSIVDRTHFRLNGTATTQNGATVKSYQYTVKDSSGKVVYSKTITSDQLKTATPNFELSNVGKYSAALSVVTSVGSKTSTKCVAPLEVVAPPICPLNPSLPVNDKDCKPCEGDSTIWYKDAECAPEITETKTAKNLSQGKDATSVTALPGDKIQYTVTVKNTGRAPAKQDIIDNLADVLEYSNLTDNGNGVHSTTGKTITWKDVTVEPGKSQTRSFVVQVMSKIPTTNTGTANPISYDCVMTNVFGSKTEVPIKCPVTKVVVETVTELPHTGPRENMLFGGILLAVVVFFYARSRQLGKEVRLIRRNVNAGTI